MPENIYQVTKETAVKTELPLGGIFLRSLAIEQTFAKNYTDFCYVIILRMMNVY